MALGEYPEVGLAQVRERLMPLRKMLASGTDPMSERRAEIEAKQQELDARKKEREERRRQAENSFEKVARKNGGDGGRLANRRAMPITY